MSQYSTRLILADNNIVTSASEALKQNWLLSSEFYYQILNEVWLNATFGFFSDIRLISVSDQDSFILYFEFLSYPFGKETIGSM